MLRRRTHPANLGEARSYTVVVGSDVALDGIAREGEALRPPHGQVAELLGEKRKARRLCGRERVGTARRSRMR